LDRRRVLVLRALEHRAAFGDAQGLLDHLARVVGLYPYVDASSLNTSALLAYEFHRPIDFDDTTVFHRVQAEVYRRLYAGESVILSAPTSFGKSLIIDALISLKRYRNIAVIVPTLALIDETRRRLAASAQGYKVVTHPHQKAAGRNVFVLTRERALLFDPLPRIEFFVIDEFYKLGPLSDPTRAIALNQVFYRLLKQDAQFYLLGPNIERIPHGFPERYKCTFIKTDFATVVSEHIRVPRKERKETRLVNLARALKVTCPPSSYQ
jgi:hypothetical protein